MKVVISERFGGFGLSAEAVAALRVLGCEGRDFAVAHDLPRDDPRLIQVVEALGSEVASNRFSELHVIEIPDGVKWHVHEYDGFETLHEDHRSWHSDGITENC